MTKPKWYDPKTNEETEYAIRERKRRRARDKRDRAARRRNR